MKTTALIKEHRLQEISFFIFLVLVLVTRTWIFFDINQQYVDFDQALLWLGATDYSNGYFYEPRFYGQAYNTFFEGLLAVPLLWMEIPVYVALPIITHLLFIFPLFFTAFYLRRKKMYNHALFVLAIVLCLPTGYDILTGIPRGFVTGLFFTSFYILSIINPTNLRLMSLNVVCAILGYFANPGSLLVSLPVMLFLLIRNYRNKNFYLVGLSSLLPAIPMYLIFDHFYKSNPDYIVHGIDSRLSITHFLNNITNLPDSFVHISFFSEDLPLLTIILLLAILPLLWRFNRAALWAYLSMILLVLLTRFSEKSTDGSSWPFFSGSRLYLGIPVVVMLFMSLVPLTKRFITMLIVLVVICFSLFKFSRINESIAFHLDQSHWNRIPVTPLSDVMAIVPFYKDVCKRENASDILVSNNFWLSNHIVYGGPALFNDYPNTYRTFFERRYHVKQKSAVTTPPRLLLISAKADMNKIIRTQGFELKRMDDYGMFLITDNTLTIDELVLRVREAEDAL